jgi:pimeloyl-ACP methyl ester carboxylesterase
MPKLEFGALTPILDAMPRPLVTASFLSVGLLLAFILILAILILRQDRLLYFPTRALASDPPAFGLRADELTLRAEDGVPLHGWWIKGDGRRALLFFHGNAGNVADRLERARILNQRFGLDIFLVDYRGYGRSGGSPSEDGLYCDGRAVYLEAVNRGFGADRIILFGESLGSAVAIQLALDRPCAALVLETPFLSIPAMAREHYPFVPVFLIRTRFDNEAKIAAVTVPTLVILAENDEIAPPAHGRRLFELVRGPKTLVVIPGAHHNDTYAIGGEAYWQAWQDFLLGS